MQRHRQGSDGLLAPFGAAYLALLGLGTVGALVVYLLLVTFVPGASGNRLDAMKTALLVIAGSGAGAGLYVQYRKQQTDEAKSALDHANSRRDQDKLFTERYTQAVAQLGNPAAAVRLGGVYALARIADDSVRDRPTCLKVLCAYLRMPYDPDDPAFDAAERQVRNTAQTVLAERLRRDHHGFWLDATVDLTGAHLINPDFHGITVGEFVAEKAILVRYARFDDATFNGNARFEEVTFKGLAVFNKTTFCGTADFDLAAFVGHARFSAATFIKGAWFAAATFDGNAEFVAATFSGDTRFSGTMFNEATFDMATFTGDAQFGGTTFNEATFQRDRPPVWPAGYTEPEGIEWADPLPPPPLQPPSVLQEPPQKP